MQVSRGRATLRARAGGWTLPELMAAVVIVGILAVIAIPAYRALVRSAHYAEAPRMLQTIRLGEERYKTLQGKYANLSSQLCTPTATGNHCYPATLPSANLVGWGGPCASCGGGQPNVDWPDLDLKIDEPVMFSYSVVAGAPGAATPTPTMRLGGGSSTISFGTAPGPDTMEWYVMSATGDPGGTGDLCMALGSSFTTQLTIEGLCQ